MQLLPNRIACNSALLNSKGANKEEMPGNSQKVFHIASISMIAIEQQLSGILLSAIRHDYLWSLCPFVCKYGRGIERKVWAAPAMPCLSTFPKKGH